MADRYLDERIMNQLMRSRFQAPAVNRGGAKMGITRQCNSALQDVSGDFDEAIITTVLQNNPQYHRDGAGVAGPRDATLLSHAAQVGDAFFQGRRDI